MHSSEAEPVRSVLIVYATDTRLVLSTARLRRRARVISLDIVTKRAPAILITALHWLLSVTERVLYSRHTTGGNMSISQQVNLREWLVPPILIPVALGLLIAGAVIVQW